MQYFARVFFHQSVYSVESLSDYWMMCEQREGIYLMRHHLLEIDGNHTYIRKHSLFSLTRGSTIPREGIIEKLIEFGYAYSDTIGDLGTYKQE